MEKISLHKEMEEILGIGKIKTKEDLEKLLKDKKRMEEAVRVIKEAGRRKK